MRELQQNLQLNNDAIKASMSSLYRLRFQYRDLEKRYNSELVEAMYTYTWWSVCNT